MLKFNTYFKILLVLSLFGCTKKNSEQVNPFPIISDYYPGKIGTYIDYEVDSIYHNDALAIHDTVHYKIRELLESNFIDDQGRNSIRIERYIAAIDSSNWVLKDIWYSTNTDVRMEKIEEDVRFMRLVNPIDESKTWNGNTMNTLNPWDYNYQQIEEPFSTGNLNFENTITVLQRDNQAENINFIENELAKETYAKEIGMVYKYYKVLITKPDFLLDPEPEAENINSGIEYTMKAINYGEL